MMDNYILTYYQQISDGSVTVGEWVRRTYEYLVKGLENKAFFYDAKKADRAISWIETYCFHTEGDLAPNRIVLEVWQKAMLSAIFGIVDGKGNRQFRECVVVMARKNGKTLLGTAIGRYIWKTEGFGTRVYTIAPKLDQAALVYDSAWIMSTLDPEYQEKRKRLEDERRSSHAKVEEDPTMEKKRMTDLYIPETNSTFKKIAFASKKSDGFNPSLQICDEVASWEGDAGLKQYEVLKSGMGSRSQPLILSISTAGYVNDGIYDELMKRCTSFLLGNSKETRLLPFLYMIDDVDRWNDLNEIRKSMPNLGVSVSYDYMLEEIAIAEGSLSKRSEFLCKYCNIKQNSSRAFLRATDVQKAVTGPLDLNDFRSCYCVAGIDLSRTTDLTAAVIIIEKAGRLYVFAHFWLPAEKIDEAQARDGVPYRAYIQRGLMSPSGENFVDYHDCYDWIVGMVQNYEILPLKVGYDRYSAQYLIQDLKAYGCQCDDVFQGFNLSGVLDEFEGLLKDGKICIGDNDLLKMHLMDSAVKQNNEDMRKRLVKVSAGVHIDGMAALLCGLTVRQKWYGEIGAQLANEGG